MNLLELQRKLIVAARSIPPNDHVPHAFEKRITALLASQPVVDAWALWGRALSRAAACCVVFMLLFAAGSFLLPAASTEPLSQDVEQTLLAAVNNNPDQDAW